jgi:high affinity sulfate transporter 1
MKALNEKFAGANIKNDILSGIIVALVSVPISMGYAQIAGLPVVYGLYGSLLPILLFSMISSSKIFIVGVDAMPAAMVGSMLAAMGIEGGTDESMKIVPLMSLFVAVWLLIFFGLKAGRVVKYISSPVMGGFISGVGATIILMQIPKLFGGSPGTGEIFVLIKNIIKESSNFNILSAILGFGTVIILLISKKLAPKFPMSIVILILGAALTAFCHVDKFGVKTLPEVTGGLPKLVLPELTIAGEHLTDMVIQSLMIALVVMAQSLLATGNYALKYNQSVDNNRELLGYAAANLASAAVGCCPINGSVSRTGMADQYGAKSQLVSITAAFTMLLILLFGTPLLKYLPVPVLTGIVISALIGILEIKLAKKLWKTSRNELIIFATAFLGVLIFGTVYGVMIGVILSFVEVVIRAVDPPKAYLGMIPGHEIFYNINRNRNARPIKNTIMYRFNGNLFFANIATLQSDIESAIKPDTKQVIIDARGISTIDFTAAERLVLLHNNLKEKGIRLYITEHGITLNDQLRKLGATTLIEQGAVRRTISLALRDAGLEKPYPLEGIENNVEIPYVEAGERLAEIEWAFGKDTEKKMREFAKEIAESMMNEDTESLEKAESTIAWGKVGLFDEDELLDYIEMYLEDIQETKAVPENRLLLLEERIIARRITLQEKLEALNPAAREMLMEHRHRLAHHLHEINPKAFRHIREHEIKIYHQLENDNPELAEKLKELYEERDD